MLLKNKVCVVTGAGQGIGQAIVEKLAMNKAECIYACDLNLEAMQAKYKNLTNIICVEVDVTKTEDIQKLTDLITTKYKTIDVLVNNAGITADSMLIKMTDEQWDKVIDVNLKGVFRMTRAILPFMIENNKGSIINMSSVVGTDGNIGQSNYGASKGGLITMSKGWAKEFPLKGAQIRVNCVAPGFVKTPMTATLPDKVLDYMVNRTPLKRMAEAEDIANGVAFLASDESNFITGQVLKIDGGLLL